MNNIQSLAREIKENFSSGMITDVYNICKQLEIEIIEAPIKADAYLQCINGKSYIILKESLEDKRKKFTIAHELGHFFIPGHSELMFGCDIKEMDFKNDYAPREREANLFASELLMPSHIVREYFDGKINYGIVSEIATMFDVSFLVALNRCIDLATEDCIVICSVNRHIKWFKATKYFPYMLNCKNVNIMSLAEELFDLKVFKIKKVIEPGYIWFSNADDISIEEESVLFPNYKQVISMIHLKDE